MTSAPLDPQAALRRSFYVLLIVIGAAGIVGRILAIDAIDSNKLESHLYHQGRADWQKKLPFLSANDRSRWLTVRSLVEFGTYKIDDVIFEPNWHSIDVVKHNDDGTAAPKVGEGHFYSSKPPLLATLVAGLYWPVYHWLGYSLGDHPYAIGRALLIVVNLPCLIAIWALLARHVERYGRTDFGRVFTVACAVFGTMLTTFGVTLNNHLVAAAAAMVLCDAVVRIAVEDDRRLRRFVQAGFFAAFLAANELPALSITCIAGAGLLWKFPRPTLAGFAPAALLVAFAALGTNYLAHGTLRPAYSQRQEGNNWYVYQYEHHGRVIDSYWSPNAYRSSIDFGEPSQPTYIFHSLIGHHGIFSQTPIWLLSVVGLTMLCFRRDEPLRAVALAIAVASIVCVTFYLTRPQLDRNYGGMASGFRWVFWFAPLWLVALLPAADGCAKRRWLRGLCLLLLAVSVLSVVYPTWNPWTKPWLMQFYEYMEWSPEGG